MNKLVERQGIVFYEADFTEEKREQFLSKFTLITLVMCGIAFLVLHHIAVLNGLAN